MTSKIALKTESVRRFLQNPGQSFFLFGPRGTGKSTWTQLLFPNALRIDLLLPDVFRTYSARGERLAELIEGNPDKRTVIIDEVQRVPDLLPVVHHLIEKKRGYQFIMTGSSARKLKRAQVDLLGGRALLRTLHPFMVAELGDAFNLDETVLIGTLPLVVASEKPHDVLKAYAALYLKEEVQMEGLVRNIGNFSRFLESISFSHAAVLNISNVARECHVERKVVEGYIGILEDLFLAFRVPVFTKRAKRATVQHQKFYFFDAGIFRSLRPSGPLDRTSEIEGAALEGVIAEHLRAWIAYQEKGEHKLYFWRTRGGAEVDFVVYGSSGLWAIEVKSAATIHREDTRSLRAFQDDYPECKSILLYRGKERLMQNGILCVPCGEFLQRLRPMDEIITK